jgi:hypothetical protein
MNQDKFRRHLAEATAHADLAFEAMHRAHDAALEQLTLPPAGQVGTVRLCSSDLWSRIRLAFRLIFTGSTTIRIQTQKPDAT